VLIVLRFHFYLHVSRRPLSRPPPHQCCAGSAQLLPDFGFIGPKGGTPWAGGDGQRCFGKVLPIPQTLVVISKMRYAVRKSKLGLELKLKQVQCGIV